MSSFSFSKFIWKQHCVPWKVRRLIQRLIPWQVRRYLLHGRANLNTPQAADARYAGRSDDVRYCENLYAHILPMLPATGRLLDAGCGLGVLLRIIQSHLPQLELHGVDFSSVAIERIRAMGFLGKHTMLPDLPYGDVLFDAIVCTEVLEHLDDPNKMVRSLRRVIRPGGRLIISVPKDLGPDHCCEHVQDYTRDTLRAYLTEGGFSVISIDTVHRETDPKLGYSYVALAMRPNHAARA